MRRVVRDCSAGNTPAPPPLLVTSGDGTKAIQAVDGTLDSDASLEMFTVEPGASSATGATVEPERGLAEGGAVSARCARCEGQLSAATGGVRADSLSPPAGSAQPCDRCAVEPQGSPSPTDP